MTEPWLRAPEQEPEEEDEEIYDENFDEMEDEPEEESSSVLENPNVQLVLSKTAVLQNKPWWYYVLIVFLLLGVFGVWYVWFTYVIIPERPELTIVIRRAITDSEAMNHQNPYL